MNVNDVVCVGAEPIALLDYLAVEQADPDVMEQIGVGLKTGAEQAGVEIPGGEVAILPELIRGHPSPNGFDLTATCFGTVALDQIVTGDADRARRRADRPAEQRPALELLLARPPRGRGPAARRPFEDGTLADALLEPTVIYVRAALELIRSDIPVHGLAHITGGGLLNLLRLNEAVGFAIEDPLPVPPIIELVSERGEVSDAEAWEVFNMGCGFVAVVPEEQADAAARAARRAPPRHPPDRHRHRRRRAASARRASPAIVRPERHR